MKPVDPGAFERRIEIDFNAGYQQQYRQYVADLDIPIGEIDALIDIVHLILPFFVDQAFYVQTDQITLQSSDKDFSASLGGATIEHRPENQSARVKGYGVKGDSNPLGPTEP